MRSKLRVWCWRGGWNKKKPKFVAVGARAGLKGLRTKLGPCRTDHPSVPTGAWVLIFRLPLLFSHWSFQHRKKPQPSNQSLGKEGGFGAGASASVHRAAWPFFQVIRVCFYPFNVRFSRLHELDPPLSKNNETCHFALRIFFFFFLEFWKFSPLNCYVHIVSTNQTLECRELGRIEATILGFLNSWCI